MNAPRIPVDAPPMTDAEILDLIQNTLRDMEQHVSMVGSLDDLICVMIGSGNELPHNALYPISEVLGQVGRSLETLLEAAFENLGRRAR